MSYWRNKPVIAAEDVAFEVAVPRIPAHTPSSRACCDNCAAEIPPGDVSLACGDSEEWSHHLCFSCLTGLYAIIQGRKGTMSDQTKPKPEPVEILSPRPLTSFPAATATKLASDKVHATPWATRMGFVYAAIQQAATRGEFGIFFPTYFGTELHPDGIRRDVPPLPAKAQHELCKRLEAEGYRITQEPVPDAHGDDTRYCRPFIHWDYAPETANAPG